MSPRRVSPVEIVENQHWQIDRRVPVSLIITFVITILVQTGTIVSWASGVNNDISSLKKDITTVQESFRVRETQLAALPKIEASQEFMREQLKELSKKLDKISERGPRNG